MEVRLGDRDDLALEQAEHLGLAGGVPGHEEDRRRPGERVQGADAAFGEAGPAALERGENEDSAYGEGERADDGQVPLPGFAAR